MYIRKYVSEAYRLLPYEPVHEISNNVVSATSKASDQSAHKRSLIRAFAGRLLFYDCQATNWTPFGVSKHLRRLQRLVRVYTCQNTTLLEITCTGSIRSDPWRYPADKHYGHITLKSSKSFHGLIWFKKIKQDGESLVSFGLCK